MFGGTGWGRDFAKIILDKVYKRCILKVKDRSGRWYIQGGLS
jgi:hypothetical protein